MSNFKFSPKASKMLIVMIGMLVLYVRWPASFESRNPSRHLTQLPPSEVEYDGVSSETLQLSQTAPYAQPFNRDMFEIHTGTYGVGW